MLAQIGNQTRGIKLAHVGELIGEERLLVQPIGRSAFGIQCQQLDQDRGGCSFPQTLRKRRFTARTVCRAHATLHQPPWSGKLWACQTALIGSLSLHSLILCEVIQRLIEVVGNRNDDIPGAAKTACFAHFRHDYELDHRLFAPAMIIPPQPMPAGSTWKGKSWLPRRSLGHARLRHLNRTHAPAKF